MKKILKGDCLQEITGYESGAVIYKENQEGFITNWSSIDGLPRFFADAQIELKKKYPGIETYKDINKGRWER